jgi:hypothetical protein
LEKSQFPYNISFKQLIGTEGTRLLREKRVEGDPTVARSAEGGPPAESECLEWKSLHIPSFRNPLPFRRLKNHPRTPNPILFRQTETIESISVFFFWLKDIADIFLLKIQNIIVLLKVP